PRRGRGPALRRGAGAVLPAPRRPDLRPAVRGGRPARDPGGDAALVRRRPRAPRRRDPAVHEPGGLGRRAHGDRSRRAVPDVGGVVIRTVLTDIEGTTSPIAFVRDVLFPYAEERLPDWLVDHADEPSV